MASSQQRSRKVWIIAGIMLVIALGAAAVTAWLVLDQPARTGEATAASTPKRASKPLFFKLDPFTVNLQTGTCGDRLLYVGITLELGNEETRDFLQEHLPQLRSQLLMVLSGQDAATLITGEGKRKLASEIGALLKKPFTQSQPTLLVDDVLFTQFIVQ